MSLRRRSLVLGWHPALVCLDDRTTPAVLVTVGAVSLEANESLRVETGTQTTTKADTLSVSAAAPAGNGHESGSHMVSNSPVTARNSVRFDSSVFGVFGAHLPYIPPLRMVFEGVSELTGGGFASGSEKLDRAFSFGTRPAGVSIRIDPSPGEPVGTPIRLVVATRVEASAGVSYPVTVPPGSVGWTTRFDSGGVSTVVANRSESLAGIDATHPVGGSDGRTFTAAVGDVVELAFRGDVTQSTSETNGTSLTRITFDVGIGIDASAATDVFTAVAADWNTEREHIDAVGNPDRADRRGVDFTYAAVGTPDANTPVGFYWATGATPDLRTATQPAGNVVPLGSLTKTDAGKLNFPAKFDRPPAGTTHLLVVIDPNNVNLDSDVSNNFAALPIRSSSILLADSLFRDVSNLSVTGKPLSPGNLVVRYHPGGGRATLSEAEVALGVDHFNWIQRLIDEPARYERFIRLPDGARKPIPLPSLDPNDEIDNLNQFFRVNTDSILSKAFPTSGANRRVDRKPFYLNEVGLPLNPGDVDPRWVRYQSRSMWLRFEDTPNRPTEWWRPGDSLRFGTHLVGVDGSGNLVVLPRDIGFAWFSDLRVDGANTYVGGGISFFKTFNNPNPAPATYAAGAGAGGRPAVVVQPPGQAARTLTVFDPGFTGGVRTAAADFTGDGVDDLLVGTGPGGASLVRVLDGTDQHELFTLAPFEASFVGGVYVAAGDVTGDGLADLIVSPDEGGGPRVRVFDGRDFSQVADFFGIDDPNFRGGARPAVGDLNGDGVGDLIVAAGFGGGPRVAAFDGTSLSEGVFTRRPFADFFAFEEGLRNGVYVAAGDIDGDGLAELVAGGGPGGGPRVTVFGGAGLSRKELDRRADFFAGDVANRGGVRVAVKNLDGDPLADLVVGSGTGAGSRVTAFGGKSLTGGAPPEQFAFDAFAGFVGGVFVG